MKSKFLLAILCLLCIVAAVKAQAPKITYTAGAKIFTLGVPIQTLAPVNTGGAIPQGYYGQVTTLCGSGRPGYQDGSAATASFGAVHSQCVDAKGNIFMADEANHVIRKITPAGVMTTFAGGNDIYKDGVGRSAGFVDPRAITVDAAGNLYVMSDRSVRKITPDTVVTTIAGGGPYGPVNGIGADASFGYPLSIAVDSKGNLYVADYDIKAIRKVTPQGVVTTFAGSFGDAGSNDGNAITARFNSINCLAVDKQDNIIAGDYDRIRKITPQGVVTTVATAEMLGIPSNNYVTSVAADATGNIYYTANQIINVISPAGIINRVAGTPADGYTAGGNTDGIGTIAQFRSPNALTYDTKGNIYLVEYQNYLVRKIRVTGYIINKQLPAGLKFDQLTGNITGFATEITPASDYVVTAFNAAGSSSYTLNIATVANVGKPAISSFNPLSGPAGTLVAIRGNNLVNTQGVVIGGINTVVLSNTNTEVVAMVMPGASTGAIALNTANGYATASSNFKLAPAYGSFTPQTRITQADVKGLAQFGWATALSADGNTLIVGAHSDNNNIGAAYIYTRNGDSWNMEARLSGLDVIGAAKQGASVAITADGNMVVVGGEGDNNATGAAWIYTRSSKIWTQQGQKIVTAALPRQQAQGSLVAVSADGSTVVVSGSSQNNYYAMITVYNRANNVWSGTNLQLPFGFQPGNTLAISAEGKVIAVGQPTYGSSRGTVRVYTKLGNSGWLSPPFELVPDGVADGSQFGSSISVSADGKYVIVGAPNFNSGQGAVWAFKREFPSTINWTQNTRIALPAAANNVRMFGRLVGASADASTIVAADAGNTDKDELRFFKRTDDKYIQQGNPVSQAASNATYYGDALSISADGSIATAGNHFDNGGVGSVAVYKAILLPEANTLSASNIVLNGASLNGTVNGKGIAAAVNFEYSTSSDMSGAKIIPADGKSSVAADQGAVTFSVALSGLAPGVTYYYRINASSTQGTVNGITKKFTTIPGLPVVTSFTPAKGAIGTLITISGDNLISPQSVIVGGVPALVISATGKQMIAMVMPGTTKGGLTINTPAGSVNASGSFKVINTSQPNFLQQQRLYLDEPDSYGRSNTKVNISADGKTALFAAYVDHGQSGVWIYKRNGDAWEKQTDNLLTGSLLFFTALSADGNTAVFTHDGVATVYVRDGEIWSKQADFKAIDPLNDAYPYNIALSADGNTLVLGSTSHMNNGAAWVYTRDRGVWTPQGAKLVCQGAVGGIDQSVIVAISADGNTIALGGYNDDNYTGATWVFTRNANGVWSQQGAKLIGTGAKHLQSQGVALSLNADGNVLAIGSVSWYDGSQNSGVWVFTRSNNTWKQQGNMIIPKDGANNSAFGEALMLSADGATMMVGGYLTDYYEGAMWCYKRTGDTWNVVNKLYLREVNPTSLGASVSMTPNGAMMLAGSDNTASTQSFVRTYTATPILSTKDAADVSTTGATVAGSADDNGNDATILFRYWEASKVGDGKTVNVSTVSGGSGMATYNAVLKNLKPNTTYIYAISAVTSSGTYTAESNTFVTSTAPVIYSFTPPRAQVGTTVAITGINFKNVTDVSFGTTAAAKFKVVSPTLINAIIAPGTTGGQIIVKNKDGSGIADGLQLFIVPQVDADATVIQQYGSTYLRTAATDGYQYQWMKNGQAIAGATDASYEVKEPASYTVRVSVDSLSQVSLPVVIVSKFILPQNAFLLTSQSLTCRGSGNGKITVDATYDSYKYTARITGNGLDKSAPFTKTVNFGGLSAGTYNVCITVEEDKNYQQCYAAVVSQPADLTLLSTVNEATKTISLSLNGGEVYHVMLNGVLHSTRDSSIVLPLAAGKNKLSVTTDKLCQGVVEKIIDITTQPAPYPNPFNGSINVFIGNKQVKKAIIDIYSVSGLLVLSKQISNPASTVTLQTGGIELPGNYTLMLDTDGTKQVFKIIKK
ncbi:hypothetical protein ABID99_002097 [Mucilaginibacter sp. OAE612]|jgi:hypothetical protein|uniref:IPT/TIG domain-containing protein n=1 Tax=Mucilaginibacter sp. OAE612 TaxID=3156444 RepID=UPI00359F061F